MEVVGGIVAKRGYYSLQRWSTGILFRPSLNPDGADVPEDVTKAILISESLPKITAECWTAMQRLFIYCIERDPRTDGGTVDANNEVCVVFAANYTNGHVVVAAMPQVVGPARVSMDRTRGACNLITGEYYPQWPPPGYAEIGDCHSHNRMGAFFSGVDDNDDKGLPGLHLVCGAYRRDEKKDNWDYRIATSIVADKMRFEKKIQVSDNDVITVSDMHFNDVTDTTFIESVTLHPDVLNHVHVEYPKDWKHESAIVRHPSVLEIPDWRKERPKGFDHWSKQTQEDFEYWQRTGQWPDTPFDRMRAARGAEDPPNGDEKSLIDEYYNLVFKTQKDLPGQTMLFDMGFDNAGRLVGGSSVPIELIRAMTEAFDDMDTMIEEIRIMVGDENRFRALFAAYLNTLMIFKHVKYRKEGNNRRQS